MGWLLLVIQIVFAAAALWGFVKSLQQHKEIAMSPSVAAAKAKVTRLSMYVGIDRLAKSTSYTPHHGRACARY